MVKINDDITIFDEQDVFSDQHEASKELAAIDLGDVVFPYGFRIERSDEKTSVLPMDKEEYVELMKLCRPDFDEAELRSCYQTGPTSCSSYYCGNGYSCRRAYSSKNKAYWCGCM